MLKSILDDAPQLPEGDLEVIGYVNMICADRTSKEDEEEDEVEGCTKYDGGGYEGACRWFGAEDLHDVWGEWRMAGLLPKAASCCCYTLSHNISGGTDWISELFVERVETG